jgi:hypothetical protein
MSLRLDYRSLNIQHKEIFPIYKGQESMRKTCQKNQLKTMFIACLILAFQVGPPCLAESSDVESALKNCQAGQPAPAQSRPKKTGPLRYVLKGLGNEAKASASDMGKDMIFVFSCQDIDPYEKKTNKDKPYTALAIRMVDGSMSSLIRYPDDSARVEGGFADGTIVAPMGGNQYAVGYPNGTRGRLEKIPGGGCKVYRPDNTVTTLKKTASGGFSLRNTKFGYMGDAVPDTSF